MTTGRSPLKLTGTSLEAVVGQMTATGLLLGGGSVVGAEVGIVIEYVIETEIGIREIEAVIECEEIGVEIVAVNEYEGIEAEIAIETETGLVRGSQKKM